MKKLILSVLFAFFVLTLFSCDWFTPKEDLITPGMRIPPALTTSTSRGTRSGVPTTVQVFEPFRTSLDVAAGILEGCYTIINTIRQSKIPDSMDTSFDGGKRIKVTYTEANEYKKRIEIYKNTTTTEPYLIILYNKGIIKGKIYYNNDASPAPETSDGHIVSLLISYNETVERPTLEIRADLADGSDNTTNPRSLYYYGVYGSTGIQVHGGLGYHYVFNPDPTNNPDKYSASHTYMYRAQVSVDETKARVELYFPLASSMADPGNSDAVSNAFLDIVFAWVNYSGNTNVQTDLTNAGITWNMDTATFKSSLLDWHNNHLNDHSLDSLLFILNLDNPIAYSSTEGYVANGTTVETVSSGVYSQAALGSLSAIVWTLKPSEVYSLVVTKP